MYRSLYLNLRRIFHLKPDYLYIKIIIIPPDGSYADLRYLRGKLAW